MQTYLPNPNKPKNEFYDLSERLLNSGESYWGNLGYWPSEIGECDYSVACAALAHKLARAVNLNKESRVFDAGFGCGDQLLMWLKDYNIEFLSGVNYSNSQTELAQTRLKSAQYLDAVEHIVVGSVADLASYEVFSNKAVNTAVNTVLALDCAYHFPSRQTFFYDSFNLLKASQKHVSPSVIHKAEIALTDLVLASEDLTWWKALLLNTMLMLSKIPRKNIVPLNEYVDQLEAAGFKNVAYEDISSQVFMPFSDWITHRLKKHRWKNQDWPNSLLTTSQAGNKTPAGVGKRSAVIKYKVTAAFLSWAYRHKVLRYIVVKAEC